MQTAIVFDTEVNRLNEPEVIELAYAPLTLSNRQIEVGEIQCLRFEPKNAFEAGAVAVHGILPDDVKGCEPSANVGKFIPAATFLVAHNVDFDADAIGDKTTRRIDTLCISRVLWPDFGSHKLSALMLELLGINRATVAMVKEAHGAIADVAMLATLLTEIVKQAPESVTLNTLSDLWMWSEDCRLPRVMQFGKFRNTPIADVPRDYVAWAMKQDDLCIYHKKAFRKAGLCQ